APARAERPRRFLGKGGVIGDSAIDPEPAEPSIDQIEMNLLAQPSLRAYAEAVAYDEHAHHQLGIDRGPSDAAVEPEPAPASARQVRQICLSTAGDDRPVCAFRARTHRTTQPVRFAEVPS